MLHGPADKEMEATVRWGGKGQPALVGNAVAQGHDAFNKTEDLPREGDGLHVGAGIHCKPPAVSKWSHCAFRGRTVITNHWLHTRRRCEQTIKYLWEMSAPSHHKIPAFSTFSPFPSHCWYQANYLRSVQGLCFTHLAQAVTCWGFMYCKKYELPTCLFQFL